jgi:hypothetical protein
VLNIETQCTISRDGVNKLPSKSVHRPSDLDNRKKHRSSGVSKSLKRPVSLAPKTAGGLAVSPLDFVVEESGNEPSAINQLIREGHYEVDFVQKQVTDSPTCGGKGASKEI